LQHLQAADCAVPYCFAVSVAGNVPGINSSLFLPAKVLGFSINFMFEGWKIV